MGITGSPAGNGKGVWPDLPTREKLKRILVEWKGNLPERIVQRSFDDAFVASNQILTIAGPRRVGKTYLCYQLIQELRKKVPDGNILYINFEDERLTPFRGDELTLLLEVFEELFEQKKGERLYVFIDEIQNVPGWGAWCRRIQETRKEVKLIITGSSSKLLSKELSTELRGRAITAVVFPYSFTEFLRSMGITAGKKGKYGAEGKVIRKAFQEYVEYGGFPQVAREAVGLKRQTLQGYFATMFYKDIVERFAVRDTALLETFLKICVGQFSSLFSLHRSVHTLASLGFNPGKGTLSTYLSHARDIFLLFQVRMFSFKRTEQLRNPSKVYAIDTGLVNAVRFSFSEDYGRHLENLVFLELLRRKGRVYYYKGKRECDFLVMDGNKIQQAIQVTKSLEGNEDREMEGLVEAMQAHELNEGLILTDAEEGRKVVGGMNITIMPVWQWLLDDTPGNIQGMETFFA